MWLFGMYLAVMIHSFHSESSVFYLSGILKSYFIIYKYSTYQYLEFIRFLHSLLPVSFRDQDSKLTFSVSLPDHLLFKFLSILLGNLFRIQWIWCLFYVFMFFGIFVSADISIFLFNLYVSSLISDCYASIFIFTDNFFNSCFVFLNLFSLWIIRYWYRW
jgi:hypothetical protein